MASERAPNGLTLAKRVCAYCEREDVALTWDGDGRLVCYPCLPAAERLVAQGREERRAIHRAVAEARDGESFRAKLREIAAETVVPDR